ncbi:alpha/beta hydrolase [Nocardia thailandica]|uniref:alpha/beta hydrolase n=1 Tax=Nocardia thailandica TaxID=257275 RepID=UPI0002F84DB7|nr:hypothetical protein [Nocardia thailandica]
MTGTGSGAAGEGFAPFCDDPRCTIPDGAYTHRFHAGDGSPARPLVLLHGSHGRETDLLPWTDMLAVGASTTAVRGSVRTGEGYAFFRRHPDRRVDAADLVARLPGLAAHLESARVAHGFDARPIVIGFSNGAIMAAALVAHHPQLFAGAVLLRPLLPFDHDSATELDGIPMLIIDGAEDRRRSPGDGRRLAAWLRRAGAVVEHRVLPVGHAITRGEVDIIREWMRMRPFPGR